MTRGLKRLAVSQPNRLSVWRTDQGSYAAAFGGGERIFYRLGFAFPEGHEGVSYGTLHLVSDTKGGYYHEALEMILAAAKPAENISRQSGCTIERQLEKARELYELHPKTAWQRAREEDRRAAQAQARENLAILATAPAGAYRAQPSPENFGGWILFPTGEGRRILFERKYVGEEIVDEAEKLMKTLGLI